MNDSKNVNIIPLYSQHLRFIIPSIVSNRVCVSVCTYVYVSLFVQFDDDNDGNNLQN